MNTQSRHQPNPLKSTRFIFMISILFAFICLSASSATIQAQESVANILAMETMSALPITDTVAMSMVVIPRAGIQFIQAGNQRIPVSDDAGIPSATDPLNTAYMIEGKEIHL